MIFINRIGRKVNELILQVNASANDGIWYTGGSNIYDTSNVLNIGDYSTEYYHSYAKWTGVNIPAGVTIKSAYVMVYYETHDGTPHATLYFNDVASPSTPTSTSDGNGKALTTANVTFNPPTSGTWVSSADIKTIIQELVNSHAPYSNGSMMMIWKGIANTGDNRGDVRTYNYAGNTFGPKLIINW